ncbi:MAG: hypothetical protein J5760_05605 [Clostridia bacterium]|nr:hypothetical protein [Clostridia bacterium]
MNAKRAKRKKLPLPVVSDVVSATECTGIAQFPAECEAEDRSLRALAGIPPAEEKREDERHE